MELKLVRVNRTELNLELKLVQTVSLSHKPQSNKKEYYTAANHYCLREGCYWRKRLPPQE